MHRVHHKMEQDETQKQINLPVIPRLDRLDLLLSYIEAQKNLPVPTAEIDHECDSCKDLTTVLEEVPVKGSLMERVASLEHRVLKLTQELEEERTKSPRKLTPSTSRCTLEELQEDEQATQTKNQTGRLTQTELEEKEKQMHELDGKKRQRKSKRKSGTNSRYTKWLSSIPTWCYKRK